MERLYCIQGQMKSGCFIDGNMLREGIILGESAVVARDGMDCSIIIPRPSISSRIVCSRRETRVDDEHDA